MEKTVSITLKYRDQATAGVNATVSKLRGSFSGLQKSTSSSAKGMAGAIGKAVGGIKGKITELAQHAKWASVFVGAAFAKIVGDAVSMAAEFEKFPVAAEFLLGSAEAADKFAKSVRDIATESIFSIDQVVNLGKRLIGSTKDTEKSESALRALIDAVAATGGGYSELESSVRAWIQTNAKAKASSEELNRQFANANIPVIRVLAEAITKDLDHPLRKYIQTAGSATGVSKKLSNAYNTATGKVGIYGKQVEKAELALKRVQESESDNREAILSKEIALEQAQVRYNSATGSINAYEKAQSGAARSTKKVALSVEEVMGQLQNIGELDIPGSVAAEAITRALQDAYGGANQRLVDSFSGQMEKLQDKVKLTVLSFLGLDDTFRIVEGSIFSRLVSALKALNEWLDKNEDRIVEFGKLLGKSLPVWIGAATFAVGIFAGALFGVLGPVIQLGIILGGFGAGIGLLIESFVDLSPLMETSAKEDIPLMTRATDTLEEATSRYEKTMMSTVEANEELKKKQLPLERATNSLKGAFDVVKTSLDNFVESIGLALDPTRDAKLSIDTVAVAVSGLVVLLTTFIEMAALAVLGWRAMAEGAIGFFKILKGDMEGAAQNFENLGRIQEAAEASWSRYTQSVDDWALRSSTAYSENTLRLNNHATNVSTTTANMSSMFDTMSMNVQGSYNNMSTVVDGASINMSTAVNTATTSMSSDTIASTSSMQSEFQTKMPAIAQLVEQNYANMQSTVDKSMPEIEKNTTSPLKRIRDWFNRVTDAIGGLIGKFHEARTLGLKAGAGFGFQHGGIVPGPVGAAVPIIAHGGEKITPRGSNRNAPFTGGGGGGGVTININGGVTLDSEQRVNQLADRIIKIMGRSNELSRMGVGHNFV